MRGMCTLDVLVLEGTLLKFSNVTQIVTLT